MNHPIHRIKQSKFISIIQNEINKLIDISKLVHVHRSLLISFSNQLRHYSNNLDQQDFNDNQIDESEQKYYEKIINIIKILQELFQSQYENRWYDYLMKHPITQIFEDLDRYTDILNKIMSGEKHGTLFVAQDSVQNDIREYLVSKIDY